MTPCGCGMGYKKIKDYYNPSESPSACCQQFTIISANLPVMVTEGGSPLPNSYNSYEADRGYTEIYDSNSSAAYKVCDPNSVRTGDQTTGQLTALEFIGMKYGESVLVPCDQRSYAQCLGPDNSGYDWYYYGDDGYESTCDELHLNVNECPSNTSDLWKQCVVEGQVLCGRVIGGTGGRKIYRKRCELNFNPSGCYSRSAGMTVRILQQLGGSFTGLGCQ
jgi:hypothetical protein